jgi:RNA polymerase sigma-70 factor (ECF subfamily)
MIRLEASLKGIETGADAAVLVARIGRGDEAALKSFYELFEARIYRYAFARLNDAFAAADIVNDVMLEVWRSAVSYAGKSQVSTWALGIARHKIVDYLRRERRHASDELLVEPADEATPSALEAIAGLQEAERLERCLARLSDEHREAIHLAFFEQLPYSEIALVADCPQGTVKTRVYHAKQALKRCLGGKA